MAIRSLFFINFIKAIHSLRCALDPDEILHGIELASGRNKRMMSI